MGLVEEIDAPGTNENDERDEAANANFVGDRENIPNTSYPNNLTN